MLSKSKVFAALAVSAGLLAAPAAHAEWRHGGWGGHGGWGEHGGYGWRHEGWGGPRYYRRGPGIGPLIGGAVLGLGAGALIAGALAPPVYYAPPRPYYPPPVVYAPPPAYGYAPPPGYYGGY